MILILPGIILYFVPTVVAVARGRQTGAVLVINIFLGWTFIGWIVALAMAASSRPQPMPIIVQQWGPYPPGYLPGYPPQIYQQTYLQPGYPQQTYPALPPQTPPGDGVQPSTPPTQQFQPGWPHDA